MPMRKRVPRRRKVARKPRRRVRRGGANNLSSLARTNYARCSEIAALVDPTSGSQVLKTNTTYSVSSSLAKTGTARAQLIARNYQEFRISKVIFRFKPLFDTFVAGAAYGGGATPQLYMYVNRDGDASGDSTAMIRMGINPISLAKDGNKTISWKPSVIYPSDTGLASIIKTSPWLNTQNQNNTSGSGFDVNATLHYGLVFNARLIDSTGSAPADVSVGLAEIETFFEFRRPYHTTQTGVDVPAVVHL